LEVSLGLALLLLQSIVEAKNAVQPEALEERGLVQRAVLEALPNQSLGNAQLPVETEALEPLENESAYRADDSVLKELAVFQGAESQGSGWVPDSTRQSQFLTVQTFLCCKKL
jgi:hypothetical protein